MVQKRQDFLSIQHDLDPKRLVFVDESGFRLGSSPRYGWAPRGQKSPGQVSAGKWQNLTMIGAIALDGFRGFMTIHAGTSTDVFLAYVEQELAPCLQEGDMVVMDILSAHKNKQVVEAIQNVGADVLFLPPYSPEFNPIEKTWAKMKDFIRKTKTLCRDTFDDAVAKAMDTISIDDIRAWVLHCGYQF